MGCIRKIKQRHGLDGLMRENSECGKQCRSESMRRRIAIVKATVLLFTLLLLSHHPLHFPHSAFKSALLKRKTKRHFKSKVALFQTSSPQCSIFGVSFRRILPSLEKGKESKTSFAYASIKSKIRKFQVVLERHRKTHYRMFAAMRPSHQRSCRRYCMIFPVGSDNAKEGYRLRTSIGRPAPRGTGVFSGI